MNKLPQSSPCGDASSLGEGAFARKGGSAAYIHTPHGQRKCEDCTFYHPEREKKPCSAFGQLENKNGDCSLYIGKAVEE